MRNMKALILCPLLCCLAVEITTASKKTAWNITKERAWNKISADTPWFPSVDCESHPQSTYDFCNITLEPKIRAADLINRLTRSELIEQTSSIAPAISRLGIKAYNWRSNCVHGWTASGGHWPSDLKWTVFPAPIGLGASFNPDLVYRVGVVTANEGRALHNVMLARNNGASTEAAGLNCFSPNVNLIRDPRWGRNQETWSEDPYHLSVLGVMYTRGLQEGDEKYLKVAACAKHYAVHSGPDNIRSKFVANVSLHDLYDTYLPAFKSQVYAAKVASIMPAYSGTRCTDCEQEVDAPDAANAFLLKTILRDQFKTPDISVISDNGAIEEVWFTHGYASSLELAAAYCMNATTDLDLGHDDIYPRFLDPAINDGYVEEGTIQQAVFRSFHLRIKLGDFDPKEMVPYHQMDANSLNTQPSQDLNVKAAQESIVLLKNSPGAKQLPIDKTKVKTIAVVGPNANASAVLLSNYEGIPSKIVSILEGIQAEVAGSGIKVTYSNGCKDVSCSDKKEFDDAIKEASNADYIVAVMGLDGGIEGEGHDRVGHPCEGKDVDALALPGCQSDLIETLAHSNSSVIVVLVNGGAVSLGDLYDNQGVVAILDVFYPGALGGTAVANVLFGRYNPGGRMPVTTYTSTKEIPTSTDYNMNTPPGRTYRYYTGKPEVPFGFGLSYTTFEYTDITLSSIVILACDSLVVKVTVQNSGKVVGDEVVQVYLTPPTIKNGPKFELVGFKRQNIDPGKSETIPITINPYLMTLVDDKGERLIHPGIYTITVSSAAPTKESSVGAITGSSHVFGIVGIDPVPISHCAKAPKCLACAS